jgi:hypothetical protein
MFQLDIGEQTVLVVGRRRAQRRQDSQFVFGACFTSAAEEFGGREQVPDFAEQGFCG